MRLELMTMESNELSLLAWQESTTGFEFIVSDYVHRVLRIYLILQANAGFGKGQILPTNDL